MLGKFVSVNFTKVNFKIASCLIKLNQTTSNIQNGLSSLGSDYAMHVLP